MLAAYPDRVERLRVQDLPHRGLTHWLRERLPKASPGAPRAPLVVVLLSYDAGRNLERLPAVAREDPPLPDVIVARYPAFLEGSSAEGPWRVVASDEAVGRDFARLFEVPAEDTEPAGPPPRAPARPRSSMSRERHAEAVEGVVHAISWGDLYQANIARRLETRLPAHDVPRFYGLLRRDNPAAFGALWAFDHDRWLASSSPECLLTFDPATRSLHSFPIKGTRPRGATADDDDALRRALLADPKERAEHVMIVDLVRNDLGRVAATGSVAVERLFDALPLPTVHHLVSDVRATLDERLDLADALAALFPGGSITGAPKIAAMAMIEEVEILRRGFYTGSLGLVFGDGEAVFNILIRTAVSVEGRLLYATGGGIVADSDPEGEWRETEAKAYAFVRALDALGSPRRD